MAITASDIESEFGSYYIAGGQGIRDLHTQLFAPSETDAIFPDIRPTEDTELRGSPVTLGSVMQGFQKAFTPLGDTTFEAQKISLFNVKIDVEEYPDDIVKSWLGFLASNDLDRQTWPFVRWWLEKLVIPKSREDWEKKAVFGGVYSAVTPGTAHPIENSVDGIKTVINAAVSDSLLTPIAMGAVPTTEAIDFVNYLEAMTNELDPVLRNALDQWNMSRTLERLFKQGMREKYNMHYDQVNRMKIVDTDINIVGLLSHEGSTKIWGTPAANRTRGYKGNDNSGTFRVESRKRQVSAFNDFWKGQGFWRFDVFATNDVELS